MRLSRRDYVVAEALELFQEKTERVHGEEEEPNHEEMKKLARDILDNKVFCHLFIEPLSLENIFKVFITLAITGSDVVPYDYKLIYQYKDKGLPSEISNKYPIFLTYRVLRIKAYEVMVEYLFDYLKRERERNKGEIK